MTEQEAKLILDVRISRFDHANDVNEALEVAKSALEEIQQYRELDDKLQMEIGITVKELYEQWNVILAEYLEYQQLGTVEELKLKIGELKRWHTDHTVEGIKNEFANTSTLICHNCDHKDEYIMELEAEVEELRKATEKQIPKKPIKMNIKWQYRCPCCNNRVTKLCPTEIETMNSRELFCSRCGQAIDWS